MFQCSCMAQSTSDGDVALRREQIMQARRLWENTALGELFAPSDSCRRRTRATRCVTLDVCYITMDAQCDKLAVDPRYCTEQSEVK